MCAVGQVLFDNRLGEVPHSAVLHHQPALLNLLQCRKSWNLDDDEVALVAQTGDGAPVVGGSSGPRVAGHLRCGDGVCPQGDGLFHDIVDVALFQRSLGCLSSVQNMHRSAYLSHSRGRRASKLRAAVPSGS